MTPSLREFLFVCCPTADVPLFGWLVHRNSFLNHRAKASARAKELAEERGMRQSNDERFKALLLVISFPFPISKVSDLGHCTSQSLKLLSSLLKDAVFWILIVIFHDLR